MHAHKVLRSYVLSGTAGTGSMAWLRDEVYAGTALVASIAADPDEGTRFYSLDHLGTPRWVTTSCAVTVVQHVYYYTWHKRRRKRYRKQINNWMAMGAAAAELSAPQPTTGTGGGCS